MDCVSSSQTPPLQTALKNMLSIPKGVELNCLVLLNLDEILAAAVTEVRQTLQADRTLLFHLTSEGVGVVLKESVLPEYPVKRPLGAGSRE